MNPAKIIGSNIKTFREQKGIKQESLAKHIGITKGRLSQIESGACEELTVSRMEKIAFYLGINFFMLMNGSVQNAYINSITRSGASTEADSPVSIELTTALADELVKRMLHP